MTAYWIGVAARAHVLRGVAGGFCQLGHGRMAPIRRLSPGDWLVYYAPRETVEGRDPVQRFVAIGRVRDGDSYEAEQGEGFHPARRDVHYLDAEEAAVRPLLEKLSFVRDPKHWGMAFRGSLISVSEEDFMTIADAMGVGVPVGAEA
ncbi:hypothetical protein ATO6_07495 [Oceanicola sp. 22II-s10i]|uniref:EVE domain-containing protein n=1 Tax=Oceanicola sp. 22II-s10i TaxID=1317116 RepID=UPI000B5262C5|nr:EVE domain-containing protein [Oceanicola sp. 22II-s10i]OWU86615.1 hypothetical protein ATO6_07495 [Oceanicola sp. 22II-s10i]